MALDAARLRTLIEGSAELGELIMRAFILRRVGLLERGVGPVVLGRAGSADLLRIESFLTRNTYPHLVISCASERGRQIINDLALPSEDLPLLICACDRVLKRPSNEAVGAWLGITPKLKADALYDIAVIGAGPAGLATAVYAASEGLSVLVLDGGVLGGQAGASARIENYLGFPTGISGLALTGRALNQAQKFGAQVAIPLVATQLRCAPIRVDPDETIELTLSEQGSVRVRAVVVASGARYKRAAVTNLKSFEGINVHYWASPAEAKLCSGEEIALVGAGNSAGQAVVYLAPRVKRLTMIIRGQGALLDERAASGLREQFIATLGHDLRNPLAAISASGEVLIRTSTDLDLLSIASRIKTNARRKSSLIDDVLDFARARLGGGIGVQLQDTVNIEASLTAVITELQDAQPDRHAYHARRQASQMRCRSRAATGLQSRQQCVDSWCGRNPCKVQRHGRRPRFDPGSLGRRRAHSREQSGSNILPILAPSYRCKPRGIGIRPAHLRADRTRSRWQNCGHLEPGKRHTLYGKIACEGTAVKKAGAGRGARFSS